MANAIAFPRFNNLGRTVTPTFLSRNRFYLKLSLHCPKMNKKSIHNIVAMVTYCATKLTATCSPMIGQFIDTMMLASTGIDVVVMTHQTLSLEKYWKLFPATLNHIWQRTFHFKDVIAAIFLDFSNRGLIR